VGHGVAEGIRVRTSAAEDFRPGAEQSQGVVPIVRDRQAIGIFAVAPHELNIDQAIGAALICRSRDLGPESG
jgi:hypothetical protein